MPPSTAILAAAERADGEKTRVRHARVPPTRQDSRARHRHAAHSKSPLTYQQPPRNDDNNPSQRRRRHHGHARNPRRRGRSGCVRPLPRRCSHVLLQRHAPVCVSAYLRMCSRVLLTQQLPQTCTPAAPTVCRGPSAAVQRDSCLAPGSHPPRLFTCVRGCSHLYVGLCACMCVCWRRAPCFRGAKGGGAQPMRTVVLYRLAIACIVHLHARIAHLLPRVHSHVTVTAPSRSLALAGHSTRKITATRTSFASTAACMRRTGTRSRRWAW